MGTIELHATSDALELSRFFEASAVGATAVAREATETAGHMLVASIFKHASGRPGPNVGTSEDHYRDSWDVSMDTTPTSVTAIIGTDKPQGRRLEWGFHGLDARGRFYDQPPFPHVGPAVAEVEPVWTAMLYNIFPGEGIVLSPTQAVRYRPVKP